MLTEYSTYDDIRKFRDKVLEKYWSMVERWLGKAIKRELLGWKRMGKAAKMYAVFKHNFTVDNQCVSLRLSPSFGVKRDGRPLSERWEESFLLVDEISNSFTTYIETDKGKVMCQFYISNEEIDIYTPHALRREHERRDYMVGIDDKNIKIVPYKRNGKDYELHVHLDSIMVVRRPEPDILIHITFLHRDMCGSKNYQELLERAGKDIDEHDIYVWK